MKRHAQDILGTFIGGITGWISQGFYNDWVQPVILSAICALVGFTVTQVCKWLIERKKKRAQVRYSSNGKGK